MDAAFPTTETSAGLQEAGTSSAPPARAPGLITSPNYANDQILLDLYHRQKADCLDARWIFERTWWRNLLYVLGRQWIYYDRRQGQWLDKRMAKWMPRPVTNKISEAHEAIQAVFTSITLATLARPIGGDLKNVSAAEVADRIQPFVHAEHAMDATMRAGDSWLISTGNCFYHPFWDKDDQTGIILIPYEQCLQCQEVWPPSKLDTSPPVCPACGGQAFKNAIGPDGQPIQDSLPQGRGRTLALSPFEIAIPPTYADFDSTHVVLHMGWHPKWYYEQRYPEIAKTLTWESTPTERSLQFIRALSTQSDLSAMPMSFGFGGGETQSQGTSEFRLWLKPTKEYPEGLFLIVIGDGGNARLVRDKSMGSPGPLPYQTKQNAPIFPFIHVGYTPVDGRMWARSPIDLVIQKQDQINQLDALILLHIQRMANPIWLEPKGAEVKSFTGEPGLVVKYSPLAAGGAKPERLPGENVPPTLFQLRQQYLDDFEQLAGTFDVLKGAKPAGVEAFSALQLLVERSQARLATVFKSRGEGYGAWYQVALELERSYGPTKRVWSILSPNGGWTYQHFENAELQGDLEIKIEDGTNAPKTALGRRAAMEHANQLGMINAADPEERYTVLTELGIPNIVKSLDTDIKSALAEQDAFEQWVASGAAEQAMPQIALVWQQYQQALMVYQQQAAQAQQIGAVTGVPPTLGPAPTPPPVTPFNLKPYHSASVHFAEHRKWANGDRARAIFVQFPLLEQIFIAHFQQTQAQIQAELMGMNAPPPQRGGAMERSNAESGSPRDVPHGQGLAAQGRGPE
jgi:hypothetical protein